MFGREKKIKIEINRIPQTLTATQVKELAMTATDLRSSADQLLAQRDELQRRLDLANAKLKEYGHVSGF